jgi:phenylpyruvate tautomerase PptA (4-oxalocrotonate tautomerase family)
MPLTCIEVRKPRPPEQVQALIEAVYQAQIEALQLPASDRQLRYVEHRPEHFHVAPGKTENYTLVRIELFSGRSLEAKRRLYRLIVEKLGRLGVAAADVFIVLHEIPLDNWGIRGGTPASEVSLGFDVNV